MKAVLVTGLNNSDKVQKARGLASEIGSYRELTSHGLLNEAALARIMEGRPRVLIVTEMDWTMENVSRVKELVSQDIWSLQHSGKRVYVEPAKLIFLCDDASFALDRGADRRFTVIRVN